MKKSLSFILFIFIILQISCRGKKKCIKSCISDAEGAYSVDSDCFSNSNGVSLEKTDEYDKMLIIFSGMIEATATLDEDCNYNIPSQDHEFSNGALLNISGSGTIDEDAITGTTITSVQGNSQTCTWAGTKY